MHLLSRVDRALRDPSINKEYLELLKSELKEEVRKHEKLKEDKIKKEDDEFELPKKKKCNDEVCEACD